MRAGWCSGSAIRPFAWLEALAGAPNRDRSGGGPVRSADHPSKRFPSQMVRSGVASPSRRIGLTCPGRSRIDGRQGLSPRPNLPHRRADHADRRQSRCGPGRDPGRPPDTGASDRGQRRPPVDQRASARPNARESGGIRVVDDLAGGHGSGLPSVCRGDLSSARTRGSNDQRPPGRARLLTAPPAPLAPGAAQNESIDPWADTTNRRRPGQRQMRTEARTPTRSPRRFRSAVPSGVERADATRFVRVPIARPWR